MALIWNDAGDFITTDSGERITTDSGDASSGMGDGDGGSTGGTGGSSGAGDWQPPSDWQGEQQRRREMMWRPFGV
jgi:hypothetical protein